MASQKRHSDDNVGDIASIGASLPSAYRGPSRKRRDAAKAASKVAGSGPTGMPARLPPCFAEVWRRRSSTLPVHQNERAALEAVAASIPEGVTEDPCAAAGLYLAALVVALRRVLQTTKTVAASSEMEKISRGEEALLSKRQRQKARKRLEKDVIAVADDLHATVRAGAEGIAAGNASKEALPDDLGKDEDLSQGDVGLIASLVYLISLALRHGSPALVNAKCEDILGAVTMAIAHVGGASLVGRHSAAAIAGTLSLLDAPAWAKPLVQRSFQQLVSLSADVDPKTRHRGREALQSLLEGPRASSIAARTSSFSASHCVSALKELQAQMEDETRLLRRTASQQAPTMLIHRISAVNYLASTFRPADASVVAKELLNIAVSKLPFVTIFALDALTALLSDTEISKHNKPDDNSVRRSDGVEQMEEGSRRPTAVPTAQLGKMLFVLAELNVSQSSHDDDTSIAYASCVSRGALSYFDAHRFSPPPVPSMVVPVKALVERMDPAISSPSVCFKLAENLRAIISHRWMKARSEIFSVLERLFEYRFKAVWSEVFGPLRHYLEQDGTAGNTLIRSALTAFTSRVLDCRSEAMQRSDRRTVGLMSSILCSVLRGGGVEIVVALVSMERDDKLLLSNAWLLPVLREHVRFSPISVFVAKFRPLGDELGKLANTAEEDGRVVEAKNAAMLASQVWDLLPAFCHSPSDLAQDAVVSDVFAIIEEGLVPAGKVSKWKSVIGGLRTLAQSVSSLSPQDPSAVGQRKLFSRHMKRAFPLIANLAEEVGADERGLILEATTVAARACCDTKVVTGFLRKSVRRMLEASVASTEDVEGENGEDAEVAPMTNTDAKNVRHTCTDLATAIAESGAIPVDAAEIRFFERAMSPLFVDPTDTILQKKAYRAAALLVSLGVIGKEDQNLISFIENTAAASSSVASSAKATRLSLVQSVVELCKARADPRNALDVCTASFLSEVVMCTRDVSEKTRTVAFLALSAFARSWYAVAGRSGEGLCEFVRLLSAGLAGRTVSMLSSTMTSLSHVIYEFRGEAGIFADVSRTVDALYGSSPEPGDALGPGTESEDPDRKEVGGGMDVEAQDGANVAVVVAGPVAILLRHSAPEVQKAALGMVKTATSALKNPPSRLKNILPAIIPGLVAIAAKSKKKETRLRVRVILERLLRRCGREAMEATFPPEHTKLLSAVRKQYSRDLTKKHESKEKRRHAREESRNRPNRSAENDGESDDDGRSEVSDSDSDLEKEILDGDELNASSRFLKDKNMGRGLRVREEKGKVVDLLDTRAGEGFMTSDEVAELSRNAMAEEKSRRHKGKKNNAFKLAEDGRPIFVDSDPENNDGASAGDNDGYNASRAVDMKRSAGSKRKREDKEPTQRSKKLKGTFGEEYRSKKGASGDMKRPGKPDPYAYIPLGVGIGRDVSKTLVKSSSRKGPARGVGRHRGSSSGRPGGRRGVPASR